MSAARGPRLARVFLSLVLPRDIRAAVLRELDEEYARYVSPGRGRVRAALWYWQQAAGSAGPAVAMRRRRRMMRSVRIVESRSHWLEQTLSDIRFGARFLRKRPGFTVAAVATLALGIGANSAIFSVVDAVVMKPLPYPEADRLVRIWSANPRGIPRNSVSPADFADLRDQSQGPHAFETLAAFTTGETGTLRGMGEPERVRTSTVSPALFATLDVRPITGRALSDLDAEGTGSSGVVISHRLWRSRFGAAPSTVGRPVTIDGSPYTVVGVMPSSFGFPAPGIDLWLPLPDAAGRRSRSAHYLDVVGRLAPGVGEAAAGEVLRTVATRLAAQYPDTNRGWGITTASLHESLVGNVRRPLLVLLAAVGCVLLIACANVASLLLARGASRSRELAVRTALGASRGRVARQQLVESSLIAAAGGASGLLIGQLALELLRASSPFELPRVQEVVLDSRVLVVTAVLSIVTGALTGLLPALRTARANPNESLKGGCAAGVEPVARRSRSVLVTVQIALSTSLVIAAGLLTMTLARLTKVDAGFNAEQVLLAQVSLPVSRYDPLLWSSFFERTLQEIRSLPGVAVAGAGGPLPLSGQQGLMRFGVRFEGKGEPQPGQVDRAYLRWATPDYFTAMGIPLVDGRTFSGSDRSDSRPVAVIDRAFAERYFAGQSPIGRRVRSTNDRTFREIIGVVGSVRQTMLDQAPEPHLYVAQSQNPSPAMTFVVRTPGNPAALGPAVRDAVRRIDPEQPVYNVRTLQDVVTGSVASQRFSALLIALVADLALLLSLVGVYGLMAGWVSESTKEIGVRMALGASTAGIYAMVFARGLRLAAAGVALGVLLAIAGTRLLSGMLYGVGTLEPVVFSGAATVVLLASALAIWLPARRALAIDPAAALRAE